MRTTSATTDGYLNRTAALVVASLLSALSIRALLQSLRRKGKSIVDEDQRYSHFIMQLSEDTIYRYRVEEPKTFLEFVSEIVTGEWQVLGPDYTEVLAFSNWLQLNMPIAIQVSQLQVIAPLHVASDDGEATGDSVPDTLPEWLR